MAGVSPNIGYMFEGLNCRDRAGLAGVSPNIGYMFEGLNCRDRAGLDLGCEDWS